MATATDCSGLNGAVTHVDSTVEVPNCGGEIITRTFFVTDTNGQSATCQQVITLQPVDLSSVVPPAHFIDADASGPNEMVLSSNDFSMANPPGVDVTGSFTVNGVPLSIGMNCDYLVSFADDFLPICGGSFDIIRSFKITNWCDPTNQILFDQFIKVQDNEGPVGTAGTATFVNASNSCFNTVMVSAATFTDASSGIATAEFAVTLSGSGAAFTSRAQGQSANFSNVPYGLYNVEWCAQDECGNESCATTSLLSLIHI